LKCERVCLHTEAIAQMCHLDPKSGKLVALCGLLVEARSA